MGLFTEHELPEIFLVRNSRYDEDYLDGYATSPEGIKRIIQKRFDEFYFGDEVLSITIEGTEVKALITDQDETYIHTFHLKKVSPI